MREIKDLKELQTIELNILLHFDEYCKKEGLRYFLAGGTLLGAVRHKGFIPWDDDVDVAMPRPDYERFLQTAKGWKDYILMCQETHSKYPKTFAKLIDPKTRAKANHFADVEDYGVFIDIFPLDGLGYEKEAVRKHADKIMYYKHRFRDAQMTYELTGNALKRAAKQVLRRILPPSYWYGKMMAEVRKFGFEESNFRASLVGGLKGRGEILEAYIYSEAMPMEFEGHELQGMKYYDEYLTCLYKDYMKIPEEKDRPEPHFRELYVLEENEK